MTTQRKGTNRPANSRRARMWGIAASAVLLMGAIGTAPAVQAETASATATAQSSMGSVTMTAGDATFDGNTARIPLTFTYEKTHPTDWTRTAITVSSQTLSARQPGSRGEWSNLDAFQYWPSGSAKTGTGTADLIISSFDFVPGVPVLIYGSAIFEDFVTTENKKEGVAFSPVISVNVNQEVTTLRDVAVSGNRVTGRATVDSTVGTTGAGGYVTVRYQRPGSNKWVKVQDFANCTNGVCQFVNARGEFDLIPVTPIPRRSQVQISLVDCNWCTNATATVRAN